MTYEKKKDYFLFFVGLVGSFQIRFVGTFYVAEIIALISSLFIPVWKFTRNKQMNKMFRFLLLWLFGALFSDLWNQTSTEPMLKGLFNILLLIAQIPFVYWALKDKTSRWIYYAAGAGISNVLNFYVFRQFMIESLIDREIWELYAWSPFFIVTSCVLYYRGNKKLGLLTLLIWALYTLFNNSRNIFLTQFVAIALVYLIERYKSISFIDNVNNYRRKIIRLLFVMVIALFVVDYVYESLASEGYLGERAYDKYMMQKYSKGGLASGRSEFLLAAEFVSHNPIIGYGSYAIDTEGLADRYRAKYGLEYSTRVYNGDDYASNAIPCHSHILGTWVWHGFLAAVWWLYFLSLIWCIFKSGAVLLNPKMLLMSVSFIMTMLFDVFFSPMGARMIYVYMSVYLILTYENFQSQLISNQYD